MSCARESDSNAIKVRKIIPSGSRVVNSPWNMLSKNKFMISTSSQQRCRYAAVADHPCTMPTIAGAPTHTIAAKSAANMPPIQREAFCGLMPLAPM